MTFVKRKESIKVNAVASVLLFTNPGTNPGDSGALVTNYKDALTRIKISPSDLSEPPYSISLPITSDTMIVVSFNCSFILLNHLPTCFFTFRVAFFVKLRYTMEIDTLLNNAFYSFLP